jgi:hypothetical protein
MIISRLTRQQAGTSLPGGARLPQQAPSPAGPIEWEGRQSVAPPFAGATLWARLISGRLALDDLWLLIVPLGMLFALNFTTIRPNDFWWHVRVGQIIATTSHVPTIDLFTFTRGGQPWTNQSWLMQLVFYWLNQAGGLPLVVFAHAATVAAGYTLVQLACLQATGGQPRPAVLATFAAAALGVSHWNVRPQIISFVCFGALLLLIEMHRRRGGRVLWAAVPIFAVWTNLHGGFMFGLALLGIYVLARIIDEWPARQCAHLPLLSKESVSALGVGLASVLALSANPAGPLGIAEYVLGFFQSKVTQTINVEFMPLNIREFDGAVFFAITLIFLWMAYRRRGRLSLYTALSLLVFGLYSLYSRRVAPWYGMMLGPAFVSLTLDPQPAHSPQAARRDTPAFNYILLAMLLICIGVSLPWLRGALPLDDEHRSLAAATETPTAATARLCALGPTTRVFNEIGFGSYQAWACPEVPVFMDTRFELYPSAMWKDYIAVSNGQHDWQDTLRQYGVNTILARKDNQKMLITAARTASDWRILYEDDMAVLFQRVTS